MSELGKLKLERERLSLLYAEKSKTSKLSEMNSYISKKKLLEHVWIEHMREDLNDWTFFGKEIRDVGLQLVRDKEIIEMNIQEVMLKIERNRDERWNIHRYAMKDFLRSQDEDKIFSIVNQGKALMFAKIQQARDKPLEEYAKTGNLDQFRKHLHEVMSKLGEYIDNEKKDTQETELCVF